MFHTLKRDERYRSRADELLNSEEMKGSRLKIPCLNGALDRAAAALLLDHKQQAREFMSQFLAGAQNVVDDEALFLQEYTDAKGKYHEFADPYHWFLRNGIALAIALNCIENITVIAKSKIILNNAYEYSDIFVSYEAYLMSLAIGDSGEIERYRSSKWDMWVEEDIVVEDNRWLAAICIAQGSAEQCQKQVDLLIGNTRKRVLAGQNLYGNNFAQVVFDLDLAALLFLAIKYELNFAKAYLSQTGLSELYPRFGCL